MQDKELFNKQLFGYDKTEVDEFVNDSIVYMMNLKKDIEFLKGEYSSMRDNLEKIRENNEMYMKTIAEAKEKAEAIVAVAEEKVQNV